MDVSHFLFIKIMSYRIWGCLNGVVTAEWVKAPALERGFPPELAAELAWAHLPWIVFVFLKSPGDSNVRLKLRTTTVGSDCRGSNPCPAL